MRAQERQRLVARERERAERDRPRDLDRDRDRGRDRERHPDRDHGVGLYARGTRDDRRGREPDRSQQWVRMIAL